jgi:hypothetical protein
MEGSDPLPYKKFTDPDADPGVQKYGSGTLKNRMGPDVWARAPIEEKPDKPTENVQTSNNQVHLHVVAVVKPKTFFFLINTIYGF